MPTNWSGPPFAVHTFNPRLCSSPGSHSGVPGSPPPAFFLTPALAFRIKHTRACFDLMVQFFSPCGRLKHPSSFPLSNSSVFTSLFALFLQFCFWAPPTHSLGLCPSFKRHLFIFWTHTTPRNCLSFFTPPTFHLLGLPTPFFPSPVPMVIDGWP